jgi:hypothetical protein
VIAASSINEKESSVAYFDKCQLATAPQPNGRNFSNCVEDADDPI